MNNEAELRWWLEHLAKLELTQIETAQAIEVAKRKVKLYSQP